MMQRYADKFPEMDIDKTDEVLVMLRRASLFIRKLEAYFMTHNLSQTRFVILMVLDREPDQEEFVISDLVRRLDVSKPVISNSLKSLEKVGFVAVSDCKSDGRAKKISITDLGRRKVYEILPGYYKMINEESDEI
jgi:DNA-binding MarR family transcriptional regulator